MCGFFQIVSLIGSALFKRKFCHHLYSLQAHRQLCFWTHTFTTFIMNRCMSRSSILSWRQWKGQSCYNLIIQDTLLPYCCPTLVKIHKEYYVLLPVIIIPREIFKNNSLFTLPFFITLQQWYFMVHFFFLLTLYPFFFSLPFTKIVGGRRNTCTT